MYPRALCACLLLAGILRADDAAFRDLSARADAARNANDVSQAVALYRQALALNPKWDQGWWYLGTLLYDSDQYKDGREAFKQVTQLRPNAGPAWGLLGLCEFETGDHSDSLTHIERSLASASDLQAGMDGVLRFHEALLLTRTGQFDRAIQVYALLVRGGSRSPELVSAIGLAALRTPLLPKEIPPEKADLFVAAGKASIFTMSGDTQNAQMALNDLAARFPDAAGVHYLRGTFLLVLDTARAVEEFKRELKINPSNFAGRCDAGVGFAARRRITDCAVLRREGRDGRAGLHHRAICLRTFAGGNGLGGTRHRAPGNSRKDRPRISRNASIAGDGLLSNRPHGRCSA